MGGSILTPRFRAARFWRPLIGIAVAYAVAAQSLLIAIGGFGPPAYAGDNVPAFTLCQHDSQGNAELPAGNPDHSGCTHCIFCFAGAHHAVIGSPPVLFARLRVALVDTHRFGEAYGLPYRFEYSIASPRGPPLGA